MIVKGEVTPDEYLGLKHGLEESVTATDHRKEARREVAEDDLSAGRQIEQTKIVPTSPKERTSFVLTDAEAAKLARWGTIIEKHYSDHYKKWTPMDMEWAKDGMTNELFIVQARPETVHASQDFSKVKEYELSGKKETIVTGSSVGSKIGAGKARVILDAKHIRDFKKGEVLVTTMTDPDWEPIMKMASAIVTDKGGRTSHAAIVSRELGIPAVVGTERATKLIKTGDPVTVDTTGSTGIIYKGILKFKVMEQDLKTLAEAEDESDGECRDSGIGVRKFVFADRGCRSCARGIHHCGKDRHASDGTSEFQRRKRLRCGKQIEAEDGGWSDPKKFYIDNLAYGIAKIGVAFFPRPVIVRFSDFKTNEYRTLLGGEMYEPKEENPMIGWRGASRYYDPKFEPAFMLECAAIKMVRDEMGLTNVIPMVPFCRTVEEGIKTQEAMAAAGLITNYIAGVRHLKKEADHADLCDVRDPGERDFCGSVPRYF